MKKARFQGKAIIQEGLDYAVAGTTGVSDIDAYMQRLDDAQEIFSTSYNRVIEAREAYDNNMPTSLKTALSSNTTSIDGGKNNKDTNESNYYPPYLQSTVDLRTETMLANLPTLSFYITDPKAINLKKAIDKKVREIYTLNNLSMKVQEVYRIAEVDGICVSQTICKPHTESCIKNDGTVDQWGNGMEIDIITYDTLGVFVDPNCNKYNIRGTAKWAIVTIGYFDSATIKSRYGIEIARGVGNAYSQTNDTNVQGLQINSGMWLKDSVPVREYYLNNGVYYTIVADSVVVSKGYANNGSFGTLPLNFTVLSPSFGNNVFGTSLQFKMEPTVNVLAAFFNIILDVNYKNMTAPLLSTAAGLADQDIPFDKKNKIIQLPSMSDADLTKQFYQPSYTIDANAVQSVLNEMKSLLNMITRTPDVAFGFQDKQIRNEAAANIIGSSVLRNSSFLVTMFEFTFMNPFAKDVLRCFYKYFEDFGGFNFIEEGQEIVIDKQDLQKIQNIHIENGSTLESASQTKLGKAMTEMQLLGMPMAAQVLKVKEILKDYLDASGVEAYEHILKSAEELMQEMQLKQQLPNIVGGQ